MDTVKVQDDSGAVSGLHPRACKEEDMRSLLLTVVGAAGLGLSCLGTSAANALIIAAPTGLRQAAEALSFTESVHCRRYRHWHRNAQEWSYGCDVGPVVTDPQSAGGVARAGVGVRGSAPRLSSPSAAGRAPGNFVNPSNPQDRSGGSNRQDMTQPRAFNPQDMR